MGSIPPPDLPRYLRVFAYLHVYVGHTGEPCVKTAEPIQMQFGRQTRVAPTIHVLQEYMAPPVEYG